MFTATRAKVTLNLFPRLSNRFLSSVTDKGHVAFLNDIAKITVPTRINTLLELLDSRGEEIVDPCKRSGINPFLIPLSYNKDDKTFTCYLRWPTQRAEMDLQIVKTNEVGATLISASTDKYCHRLVVEADFNGYTDTNQLIEKLNQDGQLYTAGDFQGLIKSGKFPTNNEKELSLIIDRYLLTKVGHFPDCYERLATDFLEKSKETSALVTCERAISMFYGWGHPINFHTKMIHSLKRDKEAGESAKASMAMPKWTLASTFQVPF